MDYRQGKERQSANHQLPFSSDTAMMWPFKQKIGQRRLEVRRGKLSAKQTMSQRLRDSGGLVTLLLALALLCGIVVMDIWPMNALALRLGQYVPRDITSRVDFSVLSLERLAARQRDIERLSPGVFVLDTALVERVVGELKKVPDRLKTTTQPAEVSKDLQ
ncbi:MAG: hypothetical protein J7M14_05385, partial [Planctomycetes bacterium]|nr:hypothetical protein [Planctomycetota bacterium]